MKSALVQKMKFAPFSLANDGSNDNGEEKMNPLTVRFFDESTGMVAVQLLNVSHNRYSLMVSQALC